ncbi:MAG TPA: T9SS type A sorting domain-containing protein [Puia sp.]|nr:T9SS type A sorting domain-containing protein [Puia sp.]
MKKSTFCNPSLFKNLVLAVAITLSVVQARAQAPKNISFSCGGPTYTYTGDYKNDLSSPYTGFVAGHPNSGIYVAGPADGHYNCHAFAWANDKSVWVQTYGGSTQAPEYYYNVGCYVQTTEADAELVVYGNIATPIHSAIRLTNSTNGFSGVYLSQYPQYAGWFVSKWDGGPVVIHSVDSCPYYYDVPSLPPTFYKKAGAAAGSNHPRGSNYSITGPKVVCSSGGTQFTLSCGQPKSFTVTWSSSSNITLSPNVNAYPITATANSAGPGGWVKATLNFPGGTSDTVTRYPVYIGPPTYISSISTSQWTAGGVGYIPITVSQSGTDFYGWPFNGGDLFPPSGVDSHGASSYTWGCSGLSYTQNPSTVGIRYTAGYFSGLGSATITLNAANACGSTSAFQSVNVTSSGFRASLSPNPASGLVTVTLSDNSSPVMPQKTITNQAKAVVPASGVGSGAPVTYTVRIIDVLGTVRYTSKKTGNNFTIPVNSLKNGNYVVEISDGKTVSSKPLVVSH